MILNAASIGIAFIKVVSLSLEDTGATTWDLLTAWRNPDRCHAMRTFVIGSING
jgi:hypothetical protein